MDLHSHPYALDGGLVKQGQRLSQPLRHLRNHCLHRSRMIETTGERVAVVEDVAEAKVNTC